MHEQCIPGAPSPFSSMSHDNSCVYGPGNELELCNTYGVELLVWKRDSSSAVSHADIFNVAQQHVYNKMEQKVQPRFLKSQDGRNYLEALVTRDIDRRQKKRSVAYGNSRIGG